MNDIVLHLTEDETRLLYRLVSEKFIEPHSNIDIDYSLIILMQKLSKILKMDEEFIQVWDALNKKRGFPWADNPWVYRIQFKKHGT
jgi:hypothetical protein